jgi:uncharacterized protein (AIM24 family)
VVHGQERHQIEPMSEADLVDNIHNGSADGTTLVFTAGMSTWTAVAEIPQLASRGTDAQHPPAPPLPPGRTAHEIDFTIEGTEMQYVEVGLDPGESLFMTVFSNNGAGKQQVAFAAPFAGKILAMDLSQLQGELICQKDAFLCAAKGVSIGIAFQKKIGVGLFGGEGFIMQRLEGDGLAFLHAGGTVHLVDLKAGETLRVDTGCLVALQPSVSYDVQFVGGVKTALFGGEGLFFTHLTGPGRVWLQSLPLSRLADRIYKAAPQTGGRRKGEGSVLGGLGDLLDGK